MSNSGNRREAQVFAYLVQAHLDLASVVEALDAILKMDEMNKYQDDLLDIMKSVQDNLISVERLTDNFHDWGR